MNDIEIIGKSFYKAGGEYVKEGREGAPPVARQLIILSEKYGLKHLSQWSDDLIETCAENLVEHFHRAHGKDDIGGDIPADMVPGQVAFQLKTIRKAAEIQLANSSLSATECVKKAVAMLR